MRFLFPALFLGLAAHSPTRAPNETGVLVVQVGDAATGTFIADAQVRLPSVGRVSRTKWDGEAQFAGLQTGRYRVEVRAIGYAPGNVDIQVGGDTIPVHFNLERLSTTLDTMRVRADVPARGLREFEERRKHGLGRFFTDSALIEHRSLGMRMLLATRVPGLKVWGNGVASGAGCVVNFFLDGFAITEGWWLVRGLKVLDLDPLLLQDFAGVEVYSEINVPVQYKPKNGACVTVLLWTKW